MSSMHSLKLTWWVVKLFTLFYGAFFFRSKDVILPTIWGYRFFLPKKGFSKYSLLSIMFGLYELDWKPYFDYYIKSAEYFIDVGAAADGYYSFRALKKNKRVKSIAIEPLHFEFKYLIKNILINHASGRVIPLRIALGEGYGEVLIDGEKIRVLSLDELVRILNLPFVNIIKIDVEGAGLNVIKGAMKTINKDRPIIFLEVHNELERQALEILKAFAYDFIIRKGRIIAIPRSIDKSLKKVCKNNRITLESCRCSLKI